MLQQTIAVFLVLGLLMAALWLLRRRGGAAFSLSGPQSAMGRPGRGSRRMRVIERVVLTSQHSLHLVLIENRLVLFAASPTSCQAVDHNLYGSVDLPEKSSSARQETSF